MRARRPHGADRGARQRPGTSRSTPCATPPTPSSRPVRRLRRRSRSAARPASTGCAGAGDATLSGLSLLLRPGPPPRADLLDAAGLRPVDRASAPDPAGDRLWHPLRARKQGPGSGGPERVQAIVAHDRKTATDKFALVRALCAVGRTERPPVAWGDGEGRVPLRSLTAHWLAWYWPLLTGPRFVAQLHGEQPDSAKPVALRRALGALADDCGADGLPALLRDLGERPGAFDEPLATVAQTIRKGPVRYAGTAAAPVFRWEPPAPGERPGSGRSAGWSCRRRSGSTSPASRGGSRTRSCCGGRP